MTKTSTDEAADFCFVFAHWLNQNNLKWQRLSFCWTLNITLKTGQTFESKLDFPEIPGVHVDQEIETDKKTWWQRC